MADYASQRLGTTCFGIINNAITFNNFSVSSATHGIGYVFQAWDTNAITHVGVRYGARTGTPPTYVATLETPSTSTGFPNGTDIGSGSPTAVTFTPPADTSIDGLWQWYALTNSYTPTRGQQLCFTIRYSSGTVDGSNNSSFTSDVTGFSDSSLHGAPYVARLTTGSWAMRTVQPVFGIRTASTRYGAIIESSYATRSASTVGHRRALKFTVPSNSATTFTVKGLRFTGSIASASGKAPVMGLWSAGGVIQNVTLDSDVNASPLNSLRNHEYMFDESSLTALTPGTTYYAGLEVADGTNGGVLLNGIGVNNANDLLAHPGGTGWCLSAYDGSNWTDDTLTRPHLELILDDVTASGGGGPFGGCVF